MKMLYRHRYEAEIREIRRILGRLPMKEEVKWGRPTYTVDGRNIVILQDFKDYFAAVGNCRILTRDPVTV